MSPRLPVQSSMDTELKAMMNRRREVLGEHSLSSNSLKKKAEQTTSDPDIDEPKKINRRILDQFEDTGVPKIDEVRARVRRHFSMVSKIYKKGDVPSSEERQEGEHPDTTELRDDPISATLTETLSNDGKGICRNDHKPTVDTSENRDTADDVQPAADSIPAADEGGEKGRDSDTAATGTIFVKNVSMLDANGASGVYSGQFLGSRPHGVGVLNYRDGTTYEGTWDNGRRTGRGFAKYASGDIYEGTFKLDQRDGSGVYRWKDGRTYEGDFVLNRRDGWGTFKWPDGSQYRGEFLKGRRSGGGTFVFSDGTVYIGEFRNGKFHGCGEIKWQDGRTYRGDWRKGKAEGQGIGKQANGSILHDGAWRNDAPAK